MKVTQVAICPSEASAKAGRPALTPELLAACGARYSRDSGGLQSILSRIDPAHLEKSVDSIFRMVDYGHQSIADMVPVAMFIDGVSIWLAYYLWTLSPTAGGQESSTRYLKVSPDGLVPPQELGIPSNRLQAWRELMARCFAAYQSSLSLWEELAGQNPALMGIPASLLNDLSESARKKVARMKRNYAFDRARYFLPVAAATNLMMVMSARGWVGLCQHLLAHSRPEARCLGEFIRNELEICAPRLVKHARPLEPVRRALACEFEELAGLARRQGPSWNDPLLSDPQAAAIPFLSVMPPQGISPEDIARDLACHPDRYAPIGSSLQRMSVRFGWSAIGFAEIRDLNRHRTGTKYCPLAPQGFYFALDQLPASADGSGQQAGNAPGTGPDRQGGLGHGGRLAGPGRAGLHLLVGIGNRVPVRAHHHRRQVHLRGRIEDRAGRPFPLRQAFARRACPVVREVPCTKGLVLEGSAEPE